MQHLTIPMSDFAKGPQRQQPFDINGIIIAPFVCYEIAYPSLALDYLPQAHLFLTVSDDSWFGRSVAATQHLEIARMRSAESGRYQLVTTNTGVTAVIDDHGYIVKQAPSFQRTVVNSEVQPMQGATPWVKTLDEIESKQKLAWSIYKRNFIKTTSKKDMAETFYILQKRSCHEYQTEEGEGAGADVASLPPLIDDDTRPSRCRPTCLSKSSIRNWKL